MLIPHVFQRSAKRGGRKPQHELTDSPATARTISVQLGTMLEPAEGADLQMLAHLIEVSRIKAERVAAGPE